jgi:hypothetical protein
MSRDPQYSWALRPVDCPTCSGSGINLKAAIDNVEAGDEMGCLKYTCETCLGKCRTPIPISEFYDDGE